ncbi:MAG: hypothetical protein JWQ95_6264 [Sphaerisporangium sp.]|nr:hypothetical protein [Sphaerisporangium sp.]
MHVRSLPALLINNLRRVFKTPSTARRVAVVMLSVALPALSLWSVGAAAQTQTQQPRQAAAQVLTWTANDGMTAYKSAPTTATAGPATIVFENSAATGNTTGMTHTLTFDTSTPGYNHDVNINIIASPFDAGGGRHEVLANLTPGKYRYFCAIPGHQMVGELVVADGGGADTTPPQVSASVSGDKDAGGNYIGSATVTISASDTESGVDKVEYSLDGGAFTAYSAPVSVNQTGAHTVQYLATDKAANTSAVGSVTFSVVAALPQDTTPPQVSASVSGDKNADGNYVGSATVTISASDTESGVDKVEYSLDGGAFTAYSAPVSVNQTGAHTVQYRATDKAANTSAVGSVTFTVVAPQQKDTTPPQVSAQLTGNQDWAWNYVGSATMTISASDTESGVDKVEYSLDGQPFAVYTKPLLVDQPGTHNMSYRATDKAGNTSNVSTAKFMVVKGGSGSECSERGKGNGCKNK